MKSDLIINSDIEYIKEYLSLNNKLECDTHGQSLLHYIVISKNPDLLYLIDFNKYDINTLNIYNETPIHFALIRKSYKVAEKLISLGADCNIPDSSNTYPIHTISKSSNITMFKYIVDNTKNIDIRDRNNRTALLLALRYSKIDNVKYLEQKGANFNVLDSFNSNVYFYAVQSNNIDVIKILDNHRVNINLINSKKEHISHYVVNNCSLEIFEFLYKRGLTLKYPDTTGFTAEDVADFTTNVSITNYIKRNSNKNKLSLLEKLYEAILTRSEGIIDTLLKKNVDIYQKLHKHSVYDYVISSYDINLINIFYRNNIDLKQKDSFGKDIYQYLKETNNKELINFCNKL